MVKLTASLFVAFAFMVNASAKEGDDGYAVIYDGAIAMKKIPIERGNLYPWLDPSEIYISSCGFAQITYKQVDVVAFLAGDDNFSTKPSSFFYLTGEWCEVADALMETSSRAAHVIAYRTWGRKKYMLSRADVYVDNAGDAYVADKHFVEANNLQSLVQPIEQGDQNSGCFSPDRERPDMVDAQTNLATTGGLLCVTRGVRLKDFVLPANKSLERTRER